MCNAPHGHAEVDGKRLDAPPIFSLVAGRYLARNHPAFNCSSAGYFIAQLHEAGLPEVYKTAEEDVAFMKSDCRSPAKDETTEVAEDRRRPQMGVLAINISRPGEIEVIDLSQLFGGEPEEDLFDLLFPGSLLGSMRRRD